MRAGTKREIEQEGEKAICRFMTTVEVSVTKWASAVITNSDGADPIDSACWPGLLASNMAKYLKNFERTGRQVLELVLIHDAPTVTAISLQDRR